MRTTNRKSDKKPDLLDPHITQAKLEAFKAELENLKKKQKGAIEQVAELAKLGDFSENHAYQMAKRKLRGINNRMETLKDIIANAIVIKSGSKDGIIKIGNTVTLEANNTKKIYQILGSQETSPSSGAISYSSPLGKELIGKKVGDQFNLDLPRGRVGYKILKVE